MNNFEQTIEAFQKQQKRKLTPKEIEACKQLWETAIKPQLEQRQ